MHRLYSRLTKIILLSLMAAGFAALADEPTNNATPRQLYNDGTRKLKDGKLADAEAFLQSAVSSQNETVQAPALYNLGEVRFHQGVEELKKGPNQKATTDRSVRAYENGDAAIQSADAALASEDLQALVAAYQRGRGARKELKEAIKAVKESMDSYGSVLAKWQRSSGDFKSALELRSNDGGAKTNADLVDRRIAKLVDLQKMMMMAMQGLAQQKDTLGKKMGQMKKKMPPQSGNDSDGKGKGDDDDDDDDKQPNGPKPGEQEGNAKDGKEMNLTREEATRLLGMLKLDGDRKLPMGTDEMVKPKDKLGRDW